MSVGIPIKSNFNILVFNMTRLPFFSIFIKKKNIVIPKNHHLINNYCIHHPLRKLKFPPLSNIKFNLFFFPYIKSLKLVKKVFSTVFIHFLLKSCLNHIDLTKNLNSSLNKLKFKTQQP